MCVVWRRRRKRRRAKPTTRIPLVVKKNEEGSEEVQFPILDPHVLMHHLFTDVGLSIPPSCVKEFWNFKREVVKEEWALMSPATSAHIPLALYGDGVRLYKDQHVKMVGIWLSLPLWRCQSSRCSRWCLAAIESQKLWGSVTMDMLMARMTFSLNLLFKGRDPDGQLLCNGRVFTVTELKGDWEWHKLVFQFWSAWNRKDSVCFRCDAMLKARPGWPKFWDSDHAWKDYTLAEFISQQLSHRETTCSLHAFGVMSVLDSRPSGVPLRVPSSSIGDLLHAHAEPGTGL